MLHVEIPTLYRDVFHMYVWHILYDIWYKLGWPDLSLWKIYDTGIKGVITFIVKVITPGMRWCLNINVLHVEASSTVWEVP